MRRLIGVLLLAALAATACNGKKTGATFAPGSPSPKKGAGRSSSLALPPPPRMFAGTLSVEGANASYCERGECRSSPAARPPAPLDLPATSNVYFAVKAAPVAARLEISSPGGGSPAVDPLNAGTLMVKKLGLPAGTYTLALVVDWKNSSGRWLFGVKIGPRR